MKINKLKWRVSPEPQGRYRSFQTRAWPSAEYKNGAAAAYMANENSYEPAIHKNATDSVITLFVAQWVQKEGNWTFKWRSLGVRARSIKEGKELIETFLNGKMKDEVVHPDYRTTK